MTREHYIQFAAKIKEVVKRANDSILGRDGIAYQKAQEMADMVCEVASQDNPRFNRNKFLAACGLK